MGLLRRFKLIPKLYSFQISKHFIAFIEYLLSILNNPCDLPLIYLLDIILDPFPRISCQSLALLYIFPYLLIPLDLIGCFALSLLLFSLSFSLHLSDIKMLLFEPFYDGLELCPLVDHGIVFVLGTKQIAIDL